MPLSERCGSRASSSPIGRRPSACQGAWSCSSKGRFAAWDRQAGMVICASRMIGSTMPWVLPSLGRLVRKPKPLDRSQIRKERAGLLTFARTAPRLRAESIAISKLRAQSTILGIVLCARSNKQSSLGPGKIPRRASCRTTRRPRPRSCVYLPRPATCSCMKRTGWAIQHRPPRSSPAEDAGWADVLFPLLWPPSYRTMS